MQEVEKGRSAKPFGMLLRKYLKNGKIIDIEQYEFDRLVEITVEKQSIYKIIVEMFGNGNVILTEPVNEGGTEFKIIQPLYQKTWRARELRAGRGVR